MRNIISIVIPTKNRSNFLIRQLEYYKEINFQGPILIGDSSNINHLEFNKLEIDRSFSELNILHKNYPELNVHQTTTQLLGLVTTPYVTTSADDDFLIPAGLYKCIDFLEKHPKYSAAHGVGVRIKTHNSSPYSKITECSRKSQPVVEANTASERLLEYLFNYKDVHYCVHRLQSILSAWMETGNKDVDFYNNLLPGCVTIANGKIKELNCLSVVRHIQDAPYRNKEQLYSLTWISNSKWMLNYRNYHDILVNKLMQSDQVTLERAQDIVKQSFSIYLFKRLENECMKYDNGSNINKVGTLRSLTRRMPRFWQIYKRLRSLVLPVADKQYEISLRSLLKPSSPYHKDFMPIYHAITRK